MIAFKIQTQSAQAMIAGVAKLKAEDLVRVGGRAAANLTREHLFELDRTRPNKMGGKRTHFYADAARSVQTPTVSGSQATVVVNQVGLAQRWLGGTITAGHGTSSWSGGPTRYLTIPARPEAYGRRAGEFKDLEFVPATTDHPAMLVQALQTVLKRTKKGFKAVGEAGGMAMFWLVRSVKQEADPTVMPSDDKYNEAVGTAVNEFLALKLRGTA